MKCRVMQGLMAACLIASTVCSMREAFSGEPDEPIRRLDAHILEKTQSEEFSGTVLIGWKDRVLFSKAYGVASRRYGVPNRIDTKFNLGSMNKMFTTVAIVQLVEKGRLGYADTIDRYLDPGWVPVEIAHRVQVRHLLTHTAGFGDFFNEIFWRTPRDFYKSVDDYRRLGVGKKLLFEPGSQWAYSNFGFILLGAIVEKVAQQSYSEYVRRYVYEPAGMKNTGEFDMEDPVPNLAIGYQKVESKEGGSRWENNLFKHVIRGGPAGGGFSTVEDLFQFSLALKTDRLISPESRSLAWTEKPGTGTERSRWGYGFIIREDPRLGRMVGHSGGFFGISAALWMGLESDFTVAILSNYGGGLDAVWEDVRHCLMQLK